MLFLGHERVGLDQPNFVWIGKEVDLLDSGLIFVQGNYLKGIFLGSGECFLNSLVSSHVAMISLCQALASRTIRTKWQALAPRTMVCQRSWKWNFFSGCASGCRTQTAAPTE
jgi:hypothetical protein